MCEAAVCPASLTVCVLTDWPHPEQPAAVQEQHPQQEGGRAAEDGRAAAELPHAAQLQRCVCSPLPEPGSRAPPPLPVSGHPQFPFTLCGNAAGKLLTEDKPLFGRNRGQRL